MALDKQKLHLSITGGLDTKTDSKNVLATDFLELENVDYTKTGSLTKRNGYSELTTDVLDGDSILTGNAVASFKEELLQYSENKLYTYSEAEERWLDKGEVVFAKTEVDAIISGEGDLIDTTYATTAGISAYAARSASGAFASKAFIVDNETGTIIAQHTLAVSDVVRVEALLNRFFFIFIQGGQIKFQYVDATNPAVISAPIVMAPATSARFYSCAIGNRIFLAWRNVTNVNVSYIELPAAFTVPIVLPATATTNGFSISQENVNNVRIAYFDGSGTNGAYSTLYNYSLSAQLHTPTSFYTGSVVSSLTSIQDATDLNKSLYLATIDDSGNVQIRTTVINSVGFQVLGPVIFYKLQLNSNMVLYKDTTYFIATRKTFLSPIVGAGLSYYLLTTDGKIICRFEPNNGLEKAGIIISNLRLEEGKICFTGEALTEFQDIFTGLEGVSAVRKYCAVLDATKNYFDAEMANALHISGGVVKMYDGNRVVEHGFLETPLGIVLLQVTATGGPQGVGNTASVFPTNVSYCYLYSWYDRYGQLHRSEVSPIGNVSIPNSTSQVTASIYPLTLTEKEDVEIELYRTEPLGTIFYKVSGNTFTNKITNNKTLVSIPFTDNMPDQDLIRQEVLYTDGGVLENQPCDPSSYLVTYKNRLFSLSADGTYLQYSKLLQTNSPVEFNSEFKIYLDSKGGIATSLAVLDDNLIIFKERALFALNGEGPNSLGEQDDYRQPQLLTADSGCIEPNSLCNSAEGIFYKSEKGIYILRRGLAVDYIGDKVERYNRMQITSGTLIADVNQVRFTTSTGIALVYDYYHRRWSVYTNIEAVDAVLYKNTYTFVRSTGVVRYETPNIFMDVSSYIKAKITSSWIQMANIQGFQRFYKMLILGTYFDPHKLRISFAYDFNPSYVHDVEINTGTLLGTTTYGTDEYGDESPYGGNSPLYQFEVRPKFQKCQSFRFKIEDFKTSIDAQGFAISNFAAIVGVKSSLNKIKTTRTFGAS